MPLAANATYWMVLKGSAGSLQWAWTESAIGTGNGFQDTWGLSEDAGGIWRTFSAQPSLMQVVAAAPASACAINCPGNVTQANDLFQSGAIVNYPAPTMSGSCGAATCVPPAGSFFPIGVPSSIMPPRLSSAPAQHRRVSLRRVGFFVGGRTRREPEAAPKPRLGAPTNIRDDAASKSLSRVFAALWRRILSRSPKISK